jgi:hypothetical protein
MNTSVTTQDIIQALDIDPSVNYPSLKGEASA